MKNLLVLIGLILATIPGKGLPAQRVHVASALNNHPFNSPCSQHSTEQSSLIRKAQKNKYLIRRVEFIGNENTRDGVLRRRILLQEGNVFTRAILIKSLARVSTLKMIYPVTLSDVEARLNDEEKTIDVLICFKETRRRI